MGHVYSVTLDGVVVWSHAAIEGPWPPASDLLAALVSRGVYVDELSPEEPGFSPRSGPS